MFKCGTQVAKSVNDLGHKTEKGLLLRIKEVIHDALAARIRPEPLARTGVVKEEVGSASERIPDRDIQNEIIPQFRSLIVEYPTVSSW